MSWLQKRPQVSSPTLFFNLKNETTKLIVGLGNDGDDYKNNRHNIGFLCLDNFVLDYEEINQNWINKKDLNGLITSGTINNTKCILLKPTTMMNNSGLAVRQVSNYYKIIPENILIIHDELDLPFGKIKTQFGGGDAGHNGLKSITENLKTNQYNRIRIGIWNELSDKTDTATFVLSNFNKSEIKLIPNLKKEVSSIVSEYIFGSGSIITETRNFII
ncbi:MAG: aminoacyl-tRNA hydrolase [Patescibacteria group bacterium]|jgi:PTH1 family peptidyl-tRNA hydrolase|nr:aminoacyl-tRNA hydrolase [Patescibacteria group bacterium]